MSRKSKKPKPIRVKAWAIINNHNLANHDGHRPAVFNTRILAWNHRILNAERVVRVEIRELPRKARKR